LAKITTGVVQTSAAGIIIRIAVMSDVIRQYADSFRNEFRIRSRQKGRLAPVPSGLTNHSLSAQARPSWTIKARNSPDPTNCSGISPVINATLVEAAAEDAISWSIGLICFTWTLCAENLSAARFISIYFHLFLKGGAFRIESKGKSKTNRKKLKCPRMKWVRSLPSNEIKARILTIKWRTRCWGVG